MQKTGLSKSFPVIILGLSAIITQIVAIREFQSVLNGNELNYGLIFAAWMTITATGARIGRYIVKDKLIIISIISLQFLLLLLPALMIFFLRFLRFRLFIYGVTLNIPEIVIYLIIILTPFCIVSGVLFTLYSVKLTNEGSKISGVYFYEAIGSILGGFVFSFILIFIFNVFQSLAFLFAVNLIAIIVFALSSDEKGIGAKDKPVCIKVTVIISILLILLSALPFFFNFDYQTKKYLFKGQKILETKDTPYGNIVITKTAEQNNFFLDGTLLFSTGNPVDAEEAVHYALVQTKKHTNILLISGGICGVTKEILKYNPAEVDYTEIDPELIRLGKKYTNFNKDKRVNIINEDARLFIRKTDKLYDAVIVYLPEPSTAQLNRFYTYDFFKDLKSKLNKNAVVTLSLPLTENYVSKEAAGLNSSVYNTMKSIFKIVNIIPGAKNYYIALDKAFSYKIGDLVDSAGIENVYVNKYYYDEQSIKQRADNILKSINPKAELNRDFYPIAYYQQLLYWLSYFNINFYLLIAVLTLPFTLILIRLKPIGIGLFTGGFSAIGAELIIIFTFQFIFGNVYYMLSIIITAFMAGIAYGVNVFRKSDSLKKFISSQLLLAIYISLLPLALLFIKQISENYLVSVIMFIILTFLGASFVGVQFSSATGNINPDLIIRKKKIPTPSAIASEAYSADLYGSALGAFIISAVLLPWLGIMNLGIMLGIMNLLSAYVVIISSRKKK